MTEIRERIEEIFEDDINPSLAMHAGSATIKNITISDEKIDVIIEFHGACSGCASSESATLEGIQEYLREDLESENLFVIKEGM